MYLEPSAGLSSAQNIWDGSTNELSSRLPCVSCACRAIRHLLMLDHKSARPHARSDAPWCCAALRQCASSAGWSSSITSSLLSGSSAGSCCLNLFGRCAACGSIQTRALRSEEATTRLSASRSTAFLRRCEAQHCLFSQNPHRLNTNNSLQRKNVLKRAFTPSCLCFPRPQGWSDTCVQMHLLAAYETFGWVGCGHTGNSIRAGEGSDRQ